MHLRTALRGAASLCVALWVLPGFAANFTTQQFWVTADIAKDRSVLITETIDVTFSSRQHGIHRIIPVSVESARGTRYVKFEVKDAEVSPDGLNFQPVHYTENGNSEVDVRIGDPNNTVLGREVYKLTYRVEGAITDFPTGRPKDQHSEFYWNLIPLGWETSIERAWFRISCPSADASVVRVFVGPNGSLDAATFRKGEQPPVNNLLRGKFVGTTFEGNIFGGVPLGSGSTVAFAMPLGSLDPPPSGTDNGAYLHPVNGPLGFTLTDETSGLIGIILAIAIPGIYWVVRGERLRSPRRNVSVAFEPPAGLEVMDAAFLLHQSFGSKDFVAGVVSLAQRKFCRLYEGTGKGFGIELLGVQPPTGAIGPDVVNNLIKLYKGENANPDMTTSQRAAVFTDRSRLHGADTQLLTELASIGTFITPGMLGDSFGQNLAEARSRIGADLKARKYIYDVSKDGCAGCIAFLAVWGAVASIAFAGLMAGAGMAVGLLVMAGLIALSSNLTPTGQAAMDQLNGLKTFISSPTEARNLQHFASTDFTESLYEMLLPYAILFGAVTEWNAAFKNTALMQPEWFVGSNGDYWVNGMLANYTYADTSMSSAFAAPSSSSGGGWASGSSGFGGGGSSGGGGGGGGGGSW